MKKFLMMLAAVLCCWVISTAFTACNKENESISDYAVYDVKVETEISILNNAYDVEKQMREALRKNMDGKMKGTTEDEKCTCKRNDNKAISICDEAFKNANPSGHFTIVLQVTPLGNGLDNKTTNLKLYENL